MIDIHDFNSRLIEEIQISSKLSESNTSSIFGIETQVVQQIAELKKPQFLTQGSGCLAKANFTFDDLNKKVQITQHQSVQELNFLFLNLIQKLSKTSKLLAIGTTSVDEECCRVITDMTVSRLLRVSAANKAMFSFAVPSEFLSQINLAPDAIAAILAKNAMSLTWTEKEMA